MFHSKSKFVVTQAVINKILAMAKCGYYMEDIKAEVDLSISTLQKHIPIELRKYRPKNLLHKTSLENIKKMVKPGINIFVNGKQGIVHQVTDFNVFYKNQSERICSVKWVDIYAGLEKLEVGHLQGGNHGNNLLHER